MCNCVLGSVGGFARPAYSSIDRLYHVASYSFNSILTQEINAYTLFVCNTSFGLLLPLLLIPRAFERCIFPVLSS